MAITSLSSALPERYSKNPSQPVNSVFLSRSSLKNSPSLLANIRSWRVLDSSRARRRMPLLFMNWSISSLFPILRLPYITTNSALGLSNLWLRSESSLCLLMNTLTSIILESVLFIICAEAGGLEMCGGFCKQKSYAPAFPQMNSVASPKSWFKPPFLIQSSQD